MIIRGIKVRKSNKYCWRNGNPLIDKDIHGNPVDYNSFTVLRKKDCPIKNIDGIDCYIAAADVPQAVTLAYGATYYGYGNSYYKTILGVKYKFTPFYTVVKGQLYSGSIKTEVKED